MFRLALSSIHRAMLPFVKPFSGPAIFQAAALVDVKQWKLSPALSDGQPTAMHLAVTLRSREQESFRDLIAAAARTAGLASYKAIAEERLCRARRVFTVLQLATLRLFPSPTCR